MKKSQLRSLLAFLVISILLVTLVFAVGSNLTSPSDNSADDDGYLDLRGSCVPTSHDGTTSFNITNATLYSNVDGTWKANRTRDTRNSVGNATYFFNFTNDINQSAEGEFQWNIQCFEQNVSNQTVINSAFAGNRTIKVDYAKSTVTTTSPVDLTYSLNGNSIDVVCTGQASTAWNLTNIDLIVNQSGVLNVNQTHRPITPTEGVVVANFTINAIGNASYPDGSQISFYCLVNQTKNLSDSGTDALVVTQFSSQNRSFFVEYPPTFTLNDPPDNNFSRNARVKINYTTSSAHTSGTVFVSRLWTNETSGLWLPAASIGTINNNTHRAQDYTFDEKSVIVWGIEVSEQSNSNVINFSDNRTIGIDSIFPTVTSISPANNSVIDGTEVTFKFTPTDLNLNLVKIITNVNGSLFENYTNTSPTSGEEIVHKITVIDGTFNFSVTANDSAGNVIITSNFTFTVDTTLPNITFTGNESVDRFCDQRRLTWTTNESTNFTFYIDLDTEVIDGEIFTNSTKSINHSLDFDFNFNAEVQHFFNITSCDAGGNCNTSGQFTFDTPARVCSGWTQYAIYDGRINLSVIQNESGADLVYIWNATKQDWIFKTVGLSTNDGVIVGKSTIFHVVHLFENTNSTWFRNKTNDGVYRYNVTSESNFVSIPNLYNFGNLTFSFGNESFQFPSFIGNDTSAGDGNVTFGPFNITAFAGYNNSAQDYVAHIFNFTFANATFLQPCNGRTELVTCMETAWVASAFNVSWNTTAVYANWTI